MIIYISENLNNKKNGGSSTSGFEFLQFLRIKHKNIVVLTVDKLNFNSDKDLFYGRKVNEIKKVVTLNRPYVLKIVTFKKVLKKIYYYFKDVFKTKSCDLSNFYDEKSSENVIYVNSWSTLFDKSKIHNYDGFKKVCIVRGSPESFFWQSFDQDKNKAIRDAANYLELFDNLIFVSNNGLHAWNKMFKHPIPSYYLPNSINEIDVENALQFSISDAKDKLRINPIDFNIVVVGSIQLRKAQDILLNIVKDLIKFIPNLKFHIVGGVSDTWGGDVIYKDITNSEFSSYFVFHGHSNDQILFMQAADICLFTSRAEAFPRTVAEYMSLGKPIIASDVSGVNEMIIDGENGVLYTNDELEKLTKAIIKLHDDSDYANNLGKRAKVDYYNKFSKEIHIKNAIKVFTQIID
jgi:glycosyltransferase involved in cell wall biosynthesis